MTSLATSRLVSTFGVILALGSAAVAQRAEIEYVSRRGKELTESGTVVEHTFRGLKFKGRAEREITEDDLISIEYQRVPEGYEEGWGLYRDGDLGGASQVFDEFAKSNVRKSQMWAKENALGYAWLAARRLGRFDDALAFREALVSEFPKTHWLPRIEMTLAYDLYAQGEWAKADKAFRKIESAVRQKGYAPSYETRAGYARVRTMLAQDKVDDAEKLLAEVGSKAVGDEQRLIGKLLEGKVMVARSQLDRARGHFSSLLQDADHKKQRALVAGVSNGLGDVALAKREYKTAAFEYSRTFALYRGADDLDEELGWAYWQFANASKHLRDAAKDDDERKKWGIRHVANRNRVASEFRMTLGGQLARRELGAGR